MLFIALNREIHALLSISDRTATVKRTCYLKHELRDLVLRKALSELQTARSRGRGTQQAGEGRSVNKATNSGIVVVVTATGPRVTNKLPALLAHRARKR